MSTLKVNKIDPQTGTALEIGSSGDTMTVPSGATLDISSATLTPPATMPASSGVNLTALNATQITSGTIPDDARLPTVGIDKGGTGAGTAAAARTNLGVVPAIWVIGDKAHAAPQYDSSSGHTTVTTEWGAQVTTQSTHGAFSNDTSESINCVALAADTDYYGLYMFVFNGSYNDGRDSNFGASAVCLSMGSTAARAQAGEDKNLYIAHKTNMPNTSNFSPGGSTFASPDTPVTMQGSCMVVVDASTRFFLFAGYANEYKTTTTGEIQQWSCCRIG